MNEEDIGKIIQPFYCQYGILMHHAQILESGVLELYAIKKYVNDDMSNEEYYRILSNSNKLTLGGLNKKLFELNFIEKSLEVDLKKANEIRIYFAHRFWWEQELLLENIENLVVLHKKIEHHISFFGEILLDIKTYINNIRNENNLHIEEEMGLTDFKNREKFIKDLRLNNKNK